MLEIRQQQLRAELEEATSFLRRQQLLKALWKLQQESKEYASEEEAADRAA